MTQDTLAKRLGISRSAIGMYESGEREPDFETLEAIADTFRVDMNTLHGCTDAARTEYCLSPQIVEDTVTFPVIGEIAAGYNEIAAENWAGETIEIPRSYLRGRKESDFFVLSVHGDSMYPIYHAGDTILIRRQPTLEKSGDVGAILYDSEYATLKKIEYVKGEDWLKMVPLNPNFKPQLVTGADLERCKVLGVPVLLIRTLEAN